MTVLTLTGLAIALAVGLEPRSITTRTFSGTIRARFSSQPPPGLWAGLWAPVGLRYHALHHLLPSMPYHSLGEAHRRLKQALPADSQYHGANYDSLPKLVANLVAGSARGTAA